jgi:hypothetical protein
MIAPKIDLKDSWVGSVNSPGMMEMVVSFRNVVHKIVSFRNVMHNFSKCH